jgi:hypothetical protein
MRYTCLCGMVLMMHVRMTRLPIWWVSDSEDNQRQRRIWVVSRFLTTKIPSALLVVVVWLQHTRCPRLRRGTFSYGITRSPTQRIEWERLKHSMRMHVSSPKVPKCTCYANACSRRDLIIYLFFKRLWARPRGISSWVHVRNDHDKDINTKNILELQHVWGQGVERKVQVDGNDMMIGESLLKIEF